MEYTANVVVSSMHPSEAVATLERRLRDGTLAENIQAQGVVSADGRFVVLRVLGHGSSSIMCRADDCILARLIALKLFPDKALIQSVKMIKTPAQALAKISHLNILRIYDLRQ